MSDDEDDIQQAFTRLSSRMGRPIGAVDTYARTRTSTRQLRQDRLMALIEAMTDPDLTLELKDFLSRMVTVWTLSGWTVARYLATPNETDVVASLLGRLEELQAARTTKHRRTTVKRRSLTGFDEL